MVYHTCTWHSLPLNCCSVQFVSSWLQQSPRQNHWALILMRACKLSMACWQIMREPYTAEQDTMPTALEGESDLNQCHL